MLPDVAGDFEGIVNFTTDNIKVGSNTYTSEQYTPRIAGMLAGTPMTMSATYANLDEVDDVDRLTKEQQDAAVAAGKFILFFDAEKVKTGTAVTSFTTTTSEKGDSFKKIKLVDTMRQITRDIYSTVRDSYIGKYPNGNGDGFMDSPCQRQYNLMHRWSYLAKRWKSQILFHVLRDERNSGMVESDELSVPLYRVGVTTNRYVAQWKNAYVVDYQKNASIALMLHGSWHDADNTFGRSFYDVTQKNGYAQLMYESDLTEAHNLAAGLSLNHDLYDEASSLYQNRQALDRETSSGGYLQYTYKLKKKLTAMLGGRWDYSSRYGGFFTPRVHLRYSPTDKLTLRTSAGKGRRTPHALAEHSQMMASGRTFYFAERLKQEEAWNVGVSAHLMLPVKERNLEVNAEYYYTDFQNVLVVNVDGARGAHTISFENLDGSSYSHTVQVDVTYPFAGRWEVMAAGRFNDVRTTYDGELRIQPFSPRMKGLLTLSYKTNLDIWRFDVTGQLNGKGKRYDQTDYPTYFQLQAQVSREFRYFTLYAGGENLTAYRMDEPILHAENPWSEAFDATQVWGPTHGAMAYVGLRFHLKKK